MRNRLLIPRKRGLITGMAIAVLGVWGGIVAFVGPWFHYAFINHHAWSWHIGRLWLQITPGAVALVAGVALARTANRITGAFASWLAAAAGTWFIVGQAVSTVWNRGVSQAGRPLGSTTLRMFEQLGSFYAVGVAIVFLAALALGRFSVISARETLRAQSNTPDRRMRAVPERDATAPHPREPVAT